MNEILIFRQQFNSFVNFLYKNGYNTKETEISNEQQENNWYRTSYQNSNLRKNITFTFYSSENQYSQNQIEVFLTGPDLSSISIPAFLVFQESKATVQYKDMEKYKFKVNPDDLSNSIKLQLDGIQKVLENEMKEIFTTPMCMYISVQDLRDDY